MNNLQIAYSNLTSNEPTTISVAGNLIKDNARNFKRDLMTILAEKPDDLYLDITGIIKMDNYGVEAIVTAHNKMSDSGRKLYLVSSDNYPVHDFLLLSRYQNILNHMRA